MARISYVDPETVSDPEIKELFETARRVGTPRPEGVAVMAHLPEVLKLWVKLRKALYQDGLLDHALKELIRIRVTQILECTY